MLKVRCATQSLLKVDLVPSIIVLVTSEGMPARQSARVSPCNA
jgi:hypothetical protein